MYESFQSFLDILGLKIWNCEEYLFHRDGNKECDAGMDRLRTWSCWWLLVIVVFWKSCFFFSFGLLLDWFISSVFHFIISTNVEENTDMRIGAFKHLSINPIEHWSVPRFVFSKARYLMSVLFSFHFRLSIRIFYDSLTWLTRNSASRLINIY